MIDWDIFILISFVDGPLGINSNRKLFISTITRQWYDRYEENRTVIEYSRIVDRKLVKGLFNFKTTQHHSRDFPAGRVQVLPFPENS